MYPPYTPVTHGSASPAIAVPGWLSRLARLCLAAAGGFCFWLLLDAPAHAADGGPDVSSGVDTVVTRPVDTVTEVADGLPPAPVEAPLPAPATPDASLEETGGPSDGLAGLAGGLHGGLHGRVEGGVEGSLGGTVRDRESAVSDTSRTGPAPGTPEAAGGAVPDNATPGHLAPDRVAPTGRTGGAGCGQAAAAEPVTSEALRVLSADRHPDPPAPRPRPCTPQVTVVPAAGGPGPCDSKGVLGGVPAVPGVSGSSPAATLFDRIRYGPAEPPVSPD